MPSLWSLVGSGSSVTSNTIPSLTWTNNTTAADIQGWIIQTYTSEELKRVVTDGATALDYLIRYTVDGPEEEGGRITGGVPGDLRRQIDEENARRARAQAALDAEARRMDGMDQMRMAARRRARQLLLSCLTVEQRACYLAHGYFDVRSCGRTYRIFQGAHGNVALLDAQGRRVETYCAQPAGVPEEDSMLAQKLSLELAPAEFFRIANVNRYPEPRA